MGRVIIAPLLGQGVEDAPSKNGPLPLKARPGWFGQQLIIGGLNQPPRLRPLRKLRGIFLMGAATPPWPRRGILRAPKSRLSFAYPAVSRIAGLNTQSNVLFFDPRHVVG